MLSRENRNYDQLMLAVEKSSIESAQKLINSGVNINPDPSMFVTTPLYEASVRGKVEIIKFLLKEGADVNLPSPQCLYATPLSGAIVGRQLEAFYILIEHGANVNAVNQFTRDTAIHEAVFLAQYKFDVAFSMIEKLLELNADIDAKDQFGKTPFERVKEWNINTWTTLEGQEIAQENFSKLEKLFTEHAKKLKNEMKLIPQKIITDVSAAFLAFF